MQNADLVTKIRRRSRSWKSSFQNLRWREVIKFAWERDDGFRMRRAFHKKEVGRTLQVCSHVCLSCSIPLSTWLPATGASAVRCRSWLYTAIRTWPCFCCLVSYSSRKYIVCRGHLDFKLHASTCCQKGIFNIHTPSP